MPAFVLPTRLTGLATKAAEGNLKRLITEPTLLIEGKGRDAISVENMLHVVIASNEDWIVPASEGERRWVLNEVSDIHLQDQTWFGPLYQQMEDGGYAAMLHDLLHLDLGELAPAPHSGKLWIARAASAKSLPCRCMVGGIVGMRHAFRCATLGIRTARELVTMRKR